MTYMIAICSEVRSSLRCKHNCSVILGSDVWGLLQLLIL